MARNDFFDTVRQVATYLKEEAPEYAKRLKAEPRSYFTKIRTMAVRYAELGRFQEAKKLFNKVQTGDDNEKRLLVSSLLEAAYHLNAIAE